MAHVNHGSLATTQVTVSPSVTLNARRFSRPFEVPHCFRRIHSGLVEAEFSTVYGELGLAYAKAPQR